MPESQQPPEGRELMLAAILAGPHDSVVDIGAGNGKWGRLLKPHVMHLAGVEAWASAAESNGLAHVYDRLIVADARAVTSWGIFDAAILGDVLEHLPRADALGLVDRLKTAGVRIFLTVPITPCPQDGTVYGNPFETHLDQWTDDELVALGWQKIHAGANEAGTVTIGTYVMEPES